MQYLIGVDNGGTFAKAAIFDTEGNQLAVSSRATHTLTPKPGYSERDMDELWSCNAQVIKEVIAKSGIDPKSIAAVSFSGHGKGLYLVDAQGRPAYNGIPSADTRAWKYVEQWRKDGTLEKIYPYTMQTVLASQPVAIMAWLRDNEPEVLKRSRYAFAVKDYIRFKLTGEANAEYTDFSGANLVNLNTGQYDRELMSLFGLEEYFDLLPPLKYSSEICGSVTAQAAMESGIPEGTPVAAGMFDVDACGIASGLVDEEGMCMIAGTWAINEFISKTPVTNGTVDLNSMYCIPGYFLVEESSPTSAGNLEWFVNELMSFEKNQSKALGQSPYTLINQWVEAIAPENSDVIYLPYLNGSNEDARARGSFLGLSTYHNKEHMARAVFEGVVFSHLTHVNKLLLNHARPDEIRLSGGAANSDVWTQIFADVFQIPVAVVSHKELGAQGAAMAAGIAVGIYADYTEAAQRCVIISKTVQPDRSKAEIYRRKFERYRLANDQLRRLWTS